MKKILVLGVVILTILFTAYLWLIIPKYTPKHKPGRGHPSRLKTVFEIPKGTTTITETVTCYSYDYDLYDYVPDNISSGTYKIIKHYDKNGFLIEDISDFGDGFFREYFYKYDEAGYKLEEGEKSWQESKDGNKKENRNYRITYEYDANKNMIKENRYQEAEEKEPSPQYIYHYDDQNKCLREKIEYSRGELWSKDMYQYDNKGNQIEMKRYGHDGNLICKDIMEYDRKGNQTKIIQYDGGGNITNTCLLLYDKQSNLIKSVGYKPDGTVIGSESFLYDKDGNVIEYNLYRVEYSDIGDKPHREKYQYLNTYKYKYDTQGNLLEETRYKTKVNFWSFLLKERFISKDTYKYEFYPEANK